MPAVAPAAPRPCALPGWVGLLPWAVYAAGLQLWPAAAAPLALAVCVGLAWRAPSPRNILDLGILAYFLLLTGLACSGGAFPLSAPAQFALCPALLALAAAVSLILRRPFTFYYAYPFAPKNRRDGRSFFLANQWITAVWMAAFALAAAAVLLPEPAWSLTRAGFILGTALALAAVGSALIGGWFHFFHAPPSG